MKSPSTDRPASDLVFDRTCSTDSTFPVLPHGAAASDLAHDLVLLSFPVPDAELPEGLTDAEQEVALMVYEGASNAEIAARRGVSVRTVGNQLDALYRKLGVSSRVELVLLLRGTTT